MKVIRASIITLLVIAALSAYAVSSIVSTQSRAAAAELRRQELERQVAEMAQQNAELEYAIDHGTEDENIENIARNKLGLVYPGEILFIDITD